MTRTGKVILGFATALVMVGLAGLAVGMWWASSLYESEQADQTRADAAFAEIRARFLGIDPAFRIGERRLVIARPPAPVTSPNTPTAVHMRRLIACYNDGTGGEPLILVDQPSADDEPIATVTARSGRSLVMAVEDADLWVRATEDETGGNQDERWIGLDRTDEATAAYVLQNWLAQLDEKL